MTLGIGPSIMNTCAFINVALCGACLDEGKSSIHF